MYAAAFLLAALCGGLYVVARETPLFAVDGVEVLGGAGDTAAQVRAALARYDGVSLVEVDPEGIQDDLERLPLVVAASVDRAFPDTLRVSVRPERPVAVLRQGETAWVVSERGRIMGEIEQGDLTKLPRVWLTQQEASLSEGAYILDREGGAAVRAIARLPKQFPMRIAAARGTIDDLRLVLGSKTELRLGEATDIRLKLEVAAVVLRHLSATERSELAYLDVSLPTRVVAGSNSQVES
ncbi:MAG: FtsQ-type POTRA domain-containing protein [Gaiellales bacterium]